METERRMMIERMRRRDHVVRKAIAGLEKLEESSSYWCEYDVPLLIVETIRETIAALRDIQYRTVSDAVIADLLVKWEVPEEQRDGHTTMTIDDAFAFAREAIAKSWEGSR